jgi:hypothetical protein
VSFSIGTFNLNNVVSRFDFTADLDTADTADPTLTTVSEPTSFSSSDPHEFKLRTYEGRLVKEKPALVLDLLPAPTRCSRRAVFRPAQAKTRVYPPLVDSYALEAPAADH